MRSSGEKGVIETVLIDFQSVLPIGILAALAAHRQITTESVPALSRYVRLGALLGLGYGLMTFWWCWYYPDWMWGYAIDAAHFSFWLWYPAFVVGLGVTGAAGALMGQVLIAKGMTWAAFALAVVSLAGLGIGFFMTLPEYNHLATYAVWHAHPAMAVLTRSDPRWVKGVAIFGSAYAVLAILGVARVFFEGRRLPAL